MIQRAAVLGAGTMGSRIAAHLANAGVTVLLFDVQTSLAEHAIEHLKTARPAALYDNSLLSAISPAGFDLDFPLLASCQWVIEAVAEDLAIKQSLLERVAPFLAPEALFTTNTSGLSVARIASKLPPSVQGRWLGVHFFNPPRYMRLVEVIPIPQTDPAALEALRTFVVERLGKTVVVAKDTPNFIANRIGLFALLNNVHLMQSLDLSIAQLDALTGPVIGWPGTATFRLMDLIGLDVLSKMAANASARGGDERADLAFPGFVKEMLKRGWLGDKSGGGFYRKDPQPSVLNWKTLEYEPLEKPRLPLIEAAMKHAALPDRLRALLEAPDAAAEFYRRMLPELWRYAEHRIPEIAEAPADIDTAMKAGFNWELGPFEMQRAAAGAMAKEAAPAKSASSRNSSISLRELGDGMTIVEFHTKLNVIDDKILSFLEETLNAPTANAYVIGSATAAHFSAGANLSFILQNIVEHNWTELERFIGAFQRMTQAVKFCVRPVVAAPFGLCLGGGAEIVLQAAYRQVYAELSMGLVEIGVGLIPGGGGVKEMALRASDGKITWEQALEVLTSGQRSGSAHQALRMGLLSAEDAVSMNRDLLLRDAIQVARRAVENKYVPPRERSQLGGADGSELGAVIERRQGSGAFTAYDAEIASHISGVLCAATNESDLLDREREIFVRLCRNPKTAERIDAMLRTGKPLRN